MAIAVTLNQFKHSKVCCLHPTFLYGTFLLLFGVNSLVFLRTF